MVSSRKSSSVKKSVASAKKKVSSEYGESLVGSRVRVYWPIDRKFYEGVIDSFDSSRKKHLVLYDDGDKEKLDMTKERWEIIEEISEAEKISLEEESDSNETYDTSPELPRRKRSRGNGWSCAKGKRGRAMANNQKADSSTTIRKSPKPASDRDGKLGNMGAKVMAAASRMSTRFQSKVNGEENFTPRLLRSCKKSYEPNSRRQKRPFGPSSKAVSKKVKKPRTSSKNIKSNSSDDDVNDVSDASASDENADAENASDDDGENASDADAENASDNDESEDSKPLLDLMKESPHVMEALKKKMKSKKGKEAREDFFENEEVDEEDEST